MVVVLAQMALVEQLKYMAVRVVPTLNLTAVAELIFIFLEALAVSVAQLVDRATFFLGSIKAVWLAATSALAQLLLTPNFLW